MALKIFKAVWFLSVLVVLAMRTGEPHHADNLLTWLAGDESVSVLRPTGTLP